MTRTHLRTLSLLLAGALSLGAATLVGLSPWWGVPILPLVWLGLLAAARSLRQAVVRRTLARDRRRGGPPSPASVAVDAAFRLRRVASGEPGFTCGDGALPDLERAACFPGNPGDEDSVVLDVLASDRSERVAIVAGLRVLHEESVAALGRPFHPLFVDAETILPLLGVRIPSFLGRWAAEQDWMRQRDLYVVERADECLAVRLIRAGMPRAALTVLGQARRSRRRRTLRRLARLLVVLRLQEAGDVGFRMDSLGVWAPAVVLVLGKRLRELIPGSPLVGAPRRGPAALEAAVRHVPELVAELSALAGDVPSIRPQIVAALAAVLDRPADAVRRDLARGLLVGRPDGVMLPHLRGLALLAERRPAEAAYEFETALQRGPDFTPAAFSLAVAHRRAGAPRRGVSVLRNHGRTNPRNADVPIYLARYLADLGDRPAARRAYREGMARFPDAMPIRVAYALDLAAWGEDAAAADEFEVARRAQPADARLALLAGRARLQAGRPRDAVEPLELAARSLRGGDRAEAQYLLLAAFREQGLHDLAKPLADELVEGLGRGQEAWLDEVAEYLEERHDFRRARRAASRARRLRGDRW